MIKAKDRMRSLSPWMVTCLGLGSESPRGGMLGDDRLPVGRDRAALVSRLLGPLRARRRRLRRTTCTCRACARGPARAEALAKRSDEPALRVEMTTRTARRRSSRTGPSPLASSTAIVPKSAAVPDDDDPRLAGPARAASGPRHMRVGRETSRRRGSASAVEG